jgi:hypothetical protein
MIVPRNKARQVLEVGSKLFKLNGIVRLDVVPTPNKLIESFFLTFFLRYYFWMSSGIIDFTQLLQSSLLSYDFGCSLIGFNN